MCLADGGAVPAPWHAIVFGWGPEDWLGRVLVLGPLTFVWVMIPIIYLLYQTERDDEGFFLMNRGVLTPLHYAQCVIIFGFPSLFCLFFAVGVRPWGTNTGGPPLMPLLVGLIFGLLAFWRTGPGLKDPQLAKDCSFQDCTVEPW